MFTVMKEHMTKMLREECVIQCQQKDQNMRRVCVLHVTCVELKSLGRRVKWIFTHAETDMHKHKTHARVAFLAAFYRVVTVAVKTQEV